MKNQWFGDQYDFRKYGLLYFLLSETCYKSILVAWMLTKDDSFKEGTIQAKIWNCLNSRKKIEYAKEFFKDLSKEKEKEIFFYDKDVTSQNREDWLNELNDIVAQKKPSLIFFDADNGFEKETTTELKQETNIYLDEIEKYITAQKDVLLYQHRTRKMHIKFDDMCIQKRDLLAKKGFQNVVIIKATGNLAFFLVLSENSPLKGKLETFTNSFQICFQDPMYLSIINPCPTQSKTN